jgi:hypothetical protein
VFRREQEGEPLRPAPAPVAAPAPAPAYEPAPHDPLHPSEVVDLTGGRAAAPSALLSAAPGRTEATEAPTVAPDPVEAIPAPAPADLLPEFARRRLTTAEENRLLAEASI